MSAIDAVSELQADLSRLLRAVKAETAKTIARQSIRDEAKRLAGLWFFEVRPKLEGAIIAADLLDRYSQDFTRLLKISSPNNRKTSYIDTLRALTKKMKAEILLPLQTAPPPPKQQPSIFDELFAQLQDSDADDVYLREAVDCARAGFIRAAAVMGWCAAIARIHRTIEKTGFATFNAASVSLASQTQGRFKRFNKPTNVSSVNELQLVFDTDILWILEGMQLLDSNQHTRLRSCFDLRNHSAHPGEAPVTPYNLLSFFSDITQIVLKNPRFA